MKWGISGTFDAPTSTVVCNKQKLLQLEGFEEDMYFSEDAIMWYRLMEMGSIYFIDEALADYRVHESQWNADATIKLKATRRFIAYERLLQYADRKHKGYISYWL